MSLPILEHFEAEQKARRQRQEAAHANTITAPIPTLTPLSQGQFPRASKEDLVKALAGPKPTSTEQAQAEQKANEIEAMPLVQRSQYETLLSNKGFVGSSHENLEEQGLLPKVKSALSWTDALGKVLEKLLEPSFWIRVLKFILGLGLIVIALLMFNRAAGMGNPDPATSITQRASHTIASRSRTRQTRISTGTRQRVQEGVKRETPSVEQDRKGRTLSGTALTQRQRARVRERDRTLTSTSELRRTAKHQ